MNPADNASLGLRLRAVPTVALEKLPLVAVATELAHCGKTGRFPLRAVLLVAALVI